MSSIFMDSPTTLKLNNIFYTCHIGQFTKTGKQSTVFYYRNFEKKEAGIQLVKKVYKPHLTHSFSLERSILERVKLYYHCCSHLPYLLTSNELTKEIIQSYCGLNLKTFLLRYANTLSIADYETLFFQVYFTVCFLSDVILASDYDNHLNNFCVYTFPVGISVKNTYRIQINIDEYLTLEFSSQFYIYRIDFGSSTINFNLQDQCYFKAINKSKINNLLNFMSRSTSGENCAYSNAPGTRIISQICKFIHSILPNSQLKDNFSNRFNYILKPQTIPPSSFWALLDNSFIKDHITEDTRGELYQLLFQNVVSLYYCLDIRHKHEYINIYSSKDSENQQINSIISREQIINQIVSKNKKWTKDSARVSINVKLDRISKYLQNSKITKEMRETYLFKQKKLLYMKEIGDVKLNLIDNLDNYTPSTVHEATTIYLRQCSFDTNLVCIQMTEKHGLCVYSTHNIDNECVITKYEGNIIGTKDNYLSLFFKTNYVKTTNRKDDIISGYTIPISGLGVGQFIRLDNSPNCSFFIIDDSIYIKAIRDIYEGEELICSDKNMEAVDEKEEDSAVESLLSIIQLSSEVNQPKLFSFSEALEKNYQIMLKEKEEKLRQNSDVNSINNNMISIDVTQDITETTVPSKPRKRKNNKITTKAKLPAKRRRRAK